MGAGLLLGLLLFTGSTGKTTARYAHPVQIAWQYNHQSNTAKQASWHIQTLHCIVTTSPVANYKNALSCFNGFIKVSLVRTTQSVAAINTARYFLPLPSFPEDPDALIFYS